MFMTPMKYVNQFILTIKDTQNLLSTTIINQNIIMKSIIIKNINLINMRSMQNQNILFIIMNRDIMLKKNQNNLKFIILDMKKLQFIRKSSMKNLLLIQWLLLNDLQGSKDD